MRLFLFLEEILMKIKIFYKFLILSFYYLMNIKKRRKDFEKNNIIIFLIYIFNISIKY